MFNTNHLHPLLRNNTGILYRDLVRYCPGVCPGVDHIDRWLLLVVMDVAVAATTVRGARLSIDGVNGSFLFHYIILVVVE